MRMNTALRYVQARANAEKAYLGAGCLQPEHFFLGLLKLSELSAEEISPSSTHKAQIDADIQGLRELLQEKA